MEILTHPNPALHTVCAPVTKADEKLKYQIAEMLRLMYAGRGVGLAAPQVGIFKQLIVMNVTADPNKSDYEYVLINPRICERRKGTQIDIEGCLSLPGIQLPVQRHKVVVFEAWSPNGKHVTNTFRGLHARCLQHELDHLQGKLIIDRGLNAAG